MTKLPEVPKNGYISLPNGCALYWSTDDSIGGCRTYISDEVGGGVGVWDTALVDQSSLLAAIVQEETLRRLEYEHARRAFDLMRAHDHPGADSTEAPRC